MEFRKYDQETDRDAILRIYSEIGWMKDTDEQKEAHRVLVEDAGRTHVAIVNGEPECMVVHCDSRLTHLSESLPMNVVGTVATSLVARKQKLASRLTASSLAVEAAEEGAILSALGMFEQGFYDRLGYGSGTYFHQVAVDPNDLSVDYEPRPPIRLTKDDYERVHASRLAGRRCHGACTPVDPRFTFVDMLCATNGFGLGYEDPDTGEITHHIWCGAENKVNGPYWVAWFAYRTREQFLELMSLVQGLGDQVSLVRMPEPAGIQLQDFERQPFTRGRIGAKGAYERKIAAFAWWQMRMMDVSACLGRTKLEGAPETRFNLTLTDPIETLLDEDASALWPGVAGDYIVTLGPECRGENGIADGLMSMRASVNTFTRMWLGVQPPTGLAFTCPDLEAPDELLAQLDRTLRMPQPQLDWSI